MALIQRYRDAKGRWSPASTRKKLKVEVWDFSKPKGKRLVIASVLKKWKSVKELRRRLVPLPSPAAPAIDTARWKEIGEGQRAIDPGKNVLQQVRELLQSIPAFRKGDALRSDVSINGKRVHTNLTNDTTSFDSITGRVAGHVFDALRMTLRVRGIYAKGELVMLRAERIDLKVTVLRIIGERRRPQLSRMPKRKPKPKAKK